MATQGPKSGRCGRGQAGVLRCRVVGLQRLHNWTSEARRNARTHGDRYTRCRCSRGPIAAEDFILRLGEGWGRKPTLLPHQVGEQGALGRRSEVEFQPSLRCVPARPAARAPRGQRAEDKRLAGARETVGCHCRRAPAAGTDTTPSAFGARSQEERTGLRRRCAHSRDSALPALHVALLAESSSRRSPAKCALAPLPRGAPRPPPGGCLGSRRWTDHRPRRRDKLPPSWAPGRLPGLRLRAPPPGTPSSRPAPPHPQAPGARRASRIRSNKAAPGGGRARGREWWRGRRCRAKAPLGRRVQREGAARTWRAEKGEESILLPARTPWLLRSSPLALLPARARPPVPGAVGRGRRGDRGGPGAWRTSRSLTSVQSERLDHCQCRHVCRGSRSDARSASAAATACSEKKRRRLGAGVEREDGKEGEGGGRREGGGGGGEESLGGLAARWRRNCFAADRPSEAA